MGMFLFQGFPTRMVYLYYILCLRYTFLAGNPRFVCLFFFFSVLFCFSFSWECIVFLSHILASSSSSVFPAMSLGFTILGEIFAYVAVFLIQPLRKSHSVFVDILVRIVL